MVTTECDVLLNTVDETNTQNATHILMSAIHRILTRPLNILRIPGCNYTLYESFRFCFTGPKRGLSRTWPCRISSMILTNGVYCFRRILKTPWQAHVTNREVCGVGLNLYIYFISIRTWVLFVNNVRKFVVCASIELECCGGRIQRLLARINGTERCSCVASLHIGPSECCVQGF